MLDCFFRTPKKCLFMVFHANQFLFQRDFLEFFTLWFPCFLTLLFQKKKIQHKPTNSSSWVWGGKTFSFTHVCKDRNAGTMEQTENETWRKGESTCFGGSASLCCIEVIQIQSETWTVQKSTAKHLNEVRNISDSIMTSVHLKLQSWICSLISCLTPVKHWPVYPKDYCKLGKSARLCRQDEMDWLRAHVRTEREAVLALDSWQSPLRATKTSPRDVEDMPEPW